MANKDTLALINEIVAEVFENTQGLVTGDVLQGNLIDIIQSRGLCEVYQALKIYYQNELIIFTNNQLYKCLLETVAGQDPNTNPEKWLQITNKGVSTRIETLVNNTPNSAIIGDKTTDEAVLIEYSISRGLLREVGTMRLSNKATDNWVSVKSELDDCGFVFAKTFNGNEIKLNWTDHNPDGNDGRLSMIVKYITV